MSLPRRFCLTRWTSLAAPDSTRCCCRWSLGAGRLGVYVSRDPIRHEITLGATSTKTATPQWLFAMWKEIDDKAFGNDFDCFADNAVCNLGVADWHGREQIRENLRAFVDRGFTAQCDLARNLSGFSPTRIRRSRIARDSTSSNLLRSADGRSARRHVSGKARSYELSALRGACRAGVRAFLF
jgi:hypothetical protein